MATGSVGQPEFISDEQMAALDQPSALPEFISDEQMAGLEAPVPQEQPGILSQLGSTALQAVKETPAAAVGLLKLPYTLGSKVYTAVTDPTPENAIEGIRGIGGTSAALAGAGAGAMAGAPLAPFTFGTSVPIGALLGGAAGGAAGILGFDKALQYLNVDPQTTPQQDVNGLVYNTVQGGLLTGAAAGAMPAARATGRLVSKPAVALVPELSPKTMATKAAATLDTPAKLQAAREVIGAKDIDAGNVLAEEAAAREAAKAQRQAQIEKMPAGREYLVRAMREPTSLQPRMSEVERGQYLENKLVPERAALAEPAAETFQAMPKEQSITYQNAKFDVADAVQAEYGTIKVDGKKRLNSAAMPNDLRQLWERFTGEANGEITPKVSLAEMQKLRQEAGSLTNTYYKAYGRSRQAPDLHAARVAEAIRDSLVPAAETAAAKGQVSGGSVSAWSDAIAQYAEMKNTFDSGAVGKGLAKAKRGELSDVYKTLTNKPEAVAQTLKAAGPQAENIKAFIRNMELDDLKASGLTESAVNKWVQKRQPIVQQAFTKEHLADIKLLAKTFTTERVMKARAKSEFAKYQAQRKVVAAQKPSVAAELNRMMSPTGKLTNLVVRPSLITGGFMTGGVGGAVAGEALTRLASKFLNSRRADARAMLFEMASDPAVAAQMNAPATPGAMSKMLIRIGQNIDGLQYSAVKNERDELPRAGQRALEMTQPRSAEAMPIDAQSLNISPLLAAIRQVESANGKYTLSPKGAKGSFQFMDATGKEYHKRLGLKEPYDPSNDAQQVKLAEAFTNDLLRKYGDPRLAIAAYNYGETKLDAHIKAAGLTPKTATWDVIGQMRGLPKETKDYVQRVVQNVQPQSGGSRGMFG